MGINNLKKEFEAECLKSEYHCYMHSCYISRLSLIKKYDTGKFSLKKSESLEDKCFLVLLTEMLPWNGALPQMEYKGYRIFYKVLKLKDVTQLS